MEAKSGKVAFVTLGLVVLVEKKGPGFTTIKNALGGSGTFSMFGARMFARKPDSLGWVIKAGVDFPANIEQSLDRWGTDLQMIRDSAALSTRGLLEYQDFTWSSKTFKYTTPVLSTSPEDLTSAGLLSSRSFHSLAKAGALMTQVTSLLALRNEAGLQRKPFLVWEPAPPFCTPDQLDETLQAFQMLSVFSPNHIELAKLFGASDDGLISKDHIEQLSRTLLERVKQLGKGDLVLLVRAAERGALLLSQEDTTRVQWLPAFYGESANEIVDATGAGNAFLGAFTSGFVETSSLHEAACRGAVAASFAIEQIGPSNLTFAEDGTELWDGDSPWSRLEKYKASMKDA